ncbi:helix-turn-helix domain-containing protein [Streptomyces sp. Ac-502]|uniref:MmyB family transcriptional regulator n=1 Tax=Streptomyces sp. Ac-502 TaxID=3342801 RepID=UPI003862A4F8
MDKEALKDLLETRRGLIDPESVGLQRPHRQGRRAAGLSQPQVDEAMHRSLGSYAALVSGRNANPSYDLLRDVAKVLALTEQEWVAAYRYARGEDPPAILHDRSGREIPGMWQDILDGISHMAYVTDCSYNLVATNRHFRALFPVTGVPPNMIEWMLLHPDARRILVDWKTVWAPYVLPQLRAARAALPDDHTLARIERAVRADPEAGALYQYKGNAQVHPDGNERPLDHPSRGRGWVAIGAAEPMSSPYSKVMIVPFYVGATPSSIRKPYLRAKAS